MKEELVDYDSKGRLFKEREARNIKVPMSPVEQRFYDAAQEVVREFFEPMGRPLAAMVYGKRAASSMHALAETLRRRAGKMGTGSGPVGGGEDDVDEDAREEQVAAAGSLDARAEKRAIDGLLADMGRAGAGSGPAGPGAVSSKWAPMMDCLAENGVAPGRGSSWWCSPSTPTPLGGWSASTARRGSAPSGTRGRTTTSSGRNSKLISWGAGSR